MTTMVQYDPDTGEIVSVLTCRQSDVPLNIKAGEHWIEGAARSETHYVANGALVAYSAAQLNVKAGAPGHKATWSNATMTWSDARTDLVVAGQARAKRDKLLAACDWTQLGDSPMVGASGIAWKAYRAALRDLTRQAGFPRTINWPTPPG